MSRRLGLLLALLVVVAAGAVSYLRSLPPDLPPPPTPAELDALRARRDALQERLRAALLALGSR